MQLISKVTELPKIEFNFEELKSELSKQLESYKNIVVAEEVLGDCKQCQKDLAGLRNKVDSYRKEKKKELSKPIEEFENKCKELINLIEEVEKPIKEGIAEFDNRKKAEKKEKAEQLIKVIIKEYGLAEEVASQIEINKRWTNLTISESEVREGIENQVKAIKAELEQKEKDRELFLNMLERENKRLENPFSIYDFNYLLKNADINVAIAEMTKAVDRRAESEKKAEEPKKEQKEEVIQEQKAYAVLKLKGNISALKAVKAFMAENNIEYEVIEQGAI